MLKPLTVWFNPWEHQSSEQVWAGLTQAIIDTSRVVLGQTTAEWQRYWLTRNADRMDRAEIRATLRRRLLQPVWPALLTLLVPVVAQAVQAKAWFTIGGLGLSGALIAGFLGVAWWRYVTHCATSYLPPDLFAGPVLSGPFAAPAVTEPLLRDPFYRARSGYLYLVQHDVREVARELRRRGYQLVVFIDDLDRCPQQTTANVFEAINIFLAQDFSSAKFVIALDPGLVARRLSEAYLPVNENAVSAANEHAASTHPDDPNAGWSFLRKLCSLSVTLPEIREAHTTRLMDNHMPVLNWLGADSVESSVPPAPRRAPRSPVFPAPVTPPAPSLPGPLPRQAARTRSPRDDQPTGVAGPAEAAPGGPGPAEAAPSGPGPVGVVPSGSATGAAEASAGGAVLAQRAGQPAETLTPVTTIRPRERPREEAASPDSGEMRYLEGDPTVREHLRALVALRGRQSMRDTKRLLNLWGFYVRLHKQMLLANIRPAPGDGEPVPSETGAMSSRLACDILTFSEILTRWPALTRALGPAQGNDSGLFLLTRAAKDSGTSPDESWRDVLDQLDIAGPEYANATRSLRRLLRLYGGNGVVDFANGVL